MNEKNLKPFKPGESGNPDGKPKGSRNRTTVAREVLSIVAKYPEATFKKLQEQYPTLKKEMTVEEMMTLIQADKAIRKQDTNAYKALMESGYGMPKQEFEHSIPERQIFKIGDQEIVFD